mmetsp:Transcript_111620/g.320651  ORF Transcript_111620/g.320651 Transcript_111620/m.320651 type:complete len:233 (-) Transcript_111620:1377-2075(-)
MLSLIATCGLAAAAFFAGPISPTRRVSRADRTKAVALNAARAQQWQIRLPRLRIRGGVRGHRKDCHRFPGASRHCLRFGATRQQARPSTSASPFQDRTLLPWRTKESSNPQAWTWTMQPRASPARHLPRLASPKASPRGGISTPSGHWRRPHKQQGLRPTMRSSPERKRPPCARRRPRCRAPTASPLQLPRATVPLSSSLARKPRRRHPPQSIRAGDADTLCSRPVQRARHC